MAAAPRYLSRAPITEALFDFRVAPPSDFQPEKFSSLRDALRDKYPIMEEMRRFEAVFEVKSGKPVTEANTSALRGFVFKSEDGKTVAQFREDGFTLNRLAPYTSWADLCPEALRLWNVYLGSTHAEKLNRLALRYINRLKLPPQGELDDWVDVGPPTFPGGPPFLATFLIQQSRHDPATGYMANIIEALNANLGADSSVLTLDIDVYKSGGLGLSDAELQPTLDGLRKLKNDIFFGAITERTAKEHE